ncbi:MAG: hypothetical protein OXB84_01500 [Halobacteriovoraceae bacterium]|nr:hypothetical protein [Halobacteriovoraceae bacterium]
MENKIAGISMKGGKDSFFCSLLEFFPNQKRWALRSLLALKNHSEDTVIKNWISEHSPQKIVVDFPLSVPACQRCRLTCPGMDRCPQEEIQEIRFRMKELLANDEKMIREDPAGYKNKRGGENDFLKESCEFQLSKAFKRRLNKGILPYLNRAVDFWVWCSYYDQLLKLFNMSYNSFGTISSAAFFRFSYLRRHLPCNLEFFEGSIYIYLIEFLKGDIITKRDIRNLSDINTAISARLQILEGIEKKLGVFMYQKDLDILLEDARAFDSFILSLGGLCIRENNIRELPQWSRPSETKMAIPFFY